MLTALASADAHTWLSVVIKTLVYVTTLVCVGSVLVHVALRSLDDEERRKLRRLAIAAAVVAGVCSALRIPIRASFLTGGSLEGAVDPMLLGMVADSPLGLGVALRLTGLALVLAIILPHRSGVWIATPGAVLAAASFAFRGHALQEPRLILGVLVTVHMLALAFWIGALLPLHRVSRRFDPARAAVVAHDFGTKAIGVVGVLFVAGIGTLMILTGGAMSALLTPYGQFFVLKLIAVIGLLGLAARNKLSLTPALFRRDSGAAEKLRRSIRLEAALVAAILIVTALLTSLTSPPREEPPVRLAGYGKLTDHRPENP